MPCPVALELFSVRNLYKEDFEACLAKTAAIGYAGVECFGEPTLPAERVAAALKASGLAIVGWHMPINLLEGGPLAGTMAYLKAIGCTRAIVPWAGPENFATREATLAFAERLMAIRKAMEPFGIALGYHNHAQEFIPHADGTLPWAVLMDNTDIIAQLDNGNALVSGTPGLDTAALAAQWPGRAVTVHVKPYSFTTGHNAMIGEDDIDWPAFISAAQGPGGAEWLIIEYECEERYSQFEGVEVCLKALQKFL